MELAQVVVRQCLVMLIYMAAGFLLFRGKKVTEEGSRSLATLLLWLVLPAVLVKSFCVSPTTEKIIFFFQSTAAGALVLGVSLLIARMLFKKAPIDRFATAFSNAGFIGIPLVQAAMGADAVFYVAGMIAMLNILQWTHGVSFMTGGRAKCTLRTVLVNPITMGTMLGLILFFTGLGVSLPNVLFSAIDGLSAMNAPLAMLILGTYLARVDIKKTVLSRQLYWVSVVRLVVIPLALYGVLFLIPIPAGIKASLMIAASAPVGANVAVYAQLHGMDYGYASQTVVLSTVLSIATIPLVALFSMF